MIRPTNGSFLARTVLFLTILCTPAVAQEEPSESERIVAIIETWLASPHRDNTSEAFTHWNEEGEIPGTCAVCHSSYGAIDWMRAPAPSPGVIDHPVATGTTVDCAVCHNASAANLTSVPFLSGASIDSFGSSAVCAVCHQGRASSRTVNAATIGLEDDVVSGDLGFINTHYAPSAATQMGGVVQIGFEYPGKVYKGQFTHVPNLNTCTDCHNPHSLKVQLDTCTSCHQGVSSFKDIRLSPMDFDGDGVTNVGIAKPIAALHALLGNTIQLYAEQVAQNPITYSSNAYPYFFNDINADGEASEDEAIFPNRYQNWTPRLLKAAYNYQLVAKDSAIYSHNPHYALQLLYDSLESLSESVDLDMAGLVRP